MFPILHSVVDTAALGKEIRARWDLKKEPFRCELITRGMNDVYLVRNGDERFAARVWRAGKQTADTVTWELEYLRHLKAKGLPVVAAIPASDGSLSFAVEAPEGTRYVCLFEWAHGQQFAHRPSPEVARRIGAAVAEVHLAGQDFRPRTARPIDFAGKIRRQFPELAARLDDRPQDRAFYEKAGEAIADALEKAYAAGAPVGPIHGDVHVRNVFVENGRLEILDFDTCGEAHLLHDAMSLLWANSFYRGTQNNRVLTSEIDDAFMAGYEEVRPIVGFERECLPLFMASKEFSYMCGMSDGMKYVGHLSMNPQTFDWFAQSVRRHVEEAGLM